MYSYTSPRSMTQTSHFRASDCLLGSVHCAVPRCLYCCCIYYNIYLKVACVTLTATSYSCTILEAVAVATKFCSASGPCCCYGPWCGPSITTQISPCGVTLPQPARRAAVLDHMKERKKERIFIYLLRAVHCYRQTNSTV